MVDKQRKAKRSWKQLGYSGQVRKRKTGEKLKSQVPNHRTSDRPYRGSGGRRRPAALDPGLVLAVLHRGDAPLARNRLDQAQLPLAMHDLEIPSAAVKR